MNTPDIVGGQLEAAKDALGIVALEVAEIEKHRDEARHEVERLKFELERSRAETAQARAETEQVRQEVSEKRGSELLLVRGGEGLARCVLEAVNATFPSAELSSLSHYQDHVQNRWHQNLRRALMGSDRFISSR